MWQLGVWEIFGIVLVSLYFVASLLRRTPGEQRTKQETSKESKDKKRLDKSCDRDSDKAGKVILNNEDAGKGLREDEGQEETSTQHVLQESIATSQITKNVPCEITAKLNATKSPSTSDELIDLDGNFSSDKSYKTIRSSGDEESLEISYDLETQFSSDYKISEALAEVGLRMHKDGKPSTSCTSEGFNSYKSEEDEKVVEEVYLSVMQDKPLEKQTETPKPESAKNTSESELEANSENARHALQISNYADSLVRDTTIKAVKDVQTYAFAEDLSIDIIGDAMSEIPQTDSVPSSSSSSESSELLHEKQLDIFVDELLKEVIENAVSDVEQIKDFANNLSDIICADSTITVITERKLKEENEALERSSYLNDRPSRLSVAEVEHLDADEKTTQPYFPSNNNQNTQTNTQQGTKVLNNNYEVISSETVSSKNDSPGIPEIRDFSAVSNEKPVELTELTAGDETAEVIFKQGLNPPDSALEQEEQTDPRAGDNFLETTQNRGPQGLDFQSGENFELNSQDDLRNEQKNKIEFTKPVQQPENDELETLEGPSVQVKLDEDTESNAQYQDETGPPAHEEHEGVVLRHKAVDKVSGSSERISWRDSLILDLENDLEESLESGSELGSPVSPPAQPAGRDLSEESDEFIDSEEDEVIDHAAEAQLGAVGGSHSPNEDIDNDDFSSDDEDYDKDDDNDNDHVFDPKLTVDGLCVSKPKEKAPLKSVDSHYNRAIVLDNGCGISKIGFAGDRVPRIIQPAVVGNPQRFSMLIGDNVNVKDYKKYGDAAVAKSGVMHLSYPMHADKLETWTDVVDLWEYLLYDELDIGEGEHPFIVTEIAKNHPKNREKLTEILFEQFSAPAMYLADQLSLSLYASGMTTGVCLSSGFSCTQAAVIYEGHTLNHTLQTLEIGGHHLTENLKQYLRDQRGHNFTSSSGWQIVNDIKEKICYLSKDHLKEVHNYKTNEGLTKFYTLPDGQMISIGYECISSMEPLFRPDLLLQANDTIASQPPVYELISRAINRCDSEIRDHARHHVTISGGTTTAQGFVPRLQSELKQIEPKIKKLRAPEHRKYSAWIGGSILGSLPTMDSQYVTVDEYADSGPRIVHRKCF